MHPGCQASALKEIPFSLELRHEPSAKSAEYIAGTTGCKGGVSGAVDVRTQSIGNDCSGSLEDDDHPETVRQSDSSRNSLVLGLRSGLDSK